MRWIALPPIVGPNTSIMEVHAIFMTTRVLVSPGPRYSHRVRVEADLIFTASAIVVSPVLDT